jgi:hypothetical protein
MWELIPLFALLIPIVAILSGTVFKPWLEMRQRGLDLSSTAATSALADYAARTDRLEQRVRVLERIVTDRGIDVADEIERLRDRPATPKSIDHQERDHA